MGRSRPRSIADGWALGYSALLLASLLSLAVVVDRRAQRLAFQDAHDLLALEAGRIERRLADAPEEDAAAQLGALVRDADPDLKLTAQLFAKDGTLLSEVGPGRAAGLELGAPHRPAHRARAQEVAGAGKYAWWVLATPRRDGGSLQVAVYSRPFVRRARRVRYGFLVALPLSAALSAGLGILLARRHARPLSELLGAMRAVRGGARFERVRLRGRGDELDRIAAEFNAALDRIEMAMNALTGFSLDAAHELRSPLTALQGRIEVALTEEAKPAELRAVLADTLEDVRRLTGLVDATLALSRTAAGIQAAQRESVRLDALLRSVAEFFGPLAEEAGVALALEAAEGPPCVVAGDPTWLRQLFVNLVENALRHTGRGERIELRLRRDRDECVAEVRDTGSGIAEGELPRIFERYRAGQGGTGIGLALGRQIVVAHGGSIRAESEPGRGTCFTVRLPASSADCARVPTG
jgi:signal transduction histidine kinase